jgi:hypothetical protein
MRLLMVSLKKAVTNFLPCTRRHRHPAPRSALAPLGARRSACHTSPGAPWRFALSRTARVRRRRRLAPRSCPCLARAAAARAACATHSASACQRASNRALRPRQAHRWVMPRSALKAKGKKELRRVFCTRAPRESSSSTTGAVRAAQTLVSLSTTAADPSKKAAGARACREPLVGARGGAVPHQLSSACRRR